MSSPGPSDKKKKSPQGSPSGRSSSGPRLAPFRHPDFTDDQIQKLTEAASTLFPVNSDNGNAESLWNLDSAGSSMQADSEDKTGIRQTRSKSEGARSSTSDESLLQIILKKLYHTEMQLTKTQQALVEAHHRLKQKELEILVLMRDKHGMRQSRQIGPVINLEKPCPEKSTRSDVQAVRTKLSPSQDCESGSDITDSSNRVEDVMSKRPMPSSVELLCRPGFLDFSSAAQVDYDIVMHNLAELNIMAGEGTTQITYTNEGATFKTPEPLLLTLYANGIVLGHGPFRDMYESSTQQFLTDIMDGYFPSELQANYPAGVAFMVKDKRNVFYNDPQHSRPFWGMGKKLVASTDSLPSLTLKRRSGFKSSKEGMLKPLSPIKSKGAIIRVPLGSKSQISPERSEMATLCPSLIEEYESEESLRKPKKQASPLHLKVRSESGDRLYHIKMSSDDTVGELKRYLNTMRPMQQTDYDLYSCYPTGVLSEDGAALSDYGFTSNAVLYLRPHFRASQ